MAEGQKAASVREWYAAYVRHQHERKAANLLESKGVEVFLPTHKSTRKWKDRNKVLSLPLFPGYLFLQCMLEEKYNVLNTPGIFFLVESGGCPCAIPQQEIEAVRRVVDSGIPAQSHAFVAEGDRVSIRSGPLAGVSGILSRFRNQYRIVLTVELLRKAVSIEVEIDNIEPAREHQAVLHGDVARAEHATARHLAARSRRAGSYL
jgi:transcription antitermination factor NusG